MPTYPNQKILSGRKFLQSEELIQSQSIQIWTLHSAAANLLTVLDDGERMVMPGASSWRQNCFSHLKSSRQMMHTFGMNQFTWWCHLIDWAPLKKNAPSLVPSSTIRLDYYGRDKPEVMPKSGHANGQVKKGCLLIRPFLTRPEEEQGCNGQQKGHGYWNWKEKNAKFPKEDALKAA